MIIKDFKVIAPGEVSAEAISSRVPLSFWGGIDVATGDITDVHSDICGQNAKGKVLCFPQERGSCSGSGVMFDMIRQGSGPAAILCHEAEAVMALAPLISKRVYGKEMPIRTVSKDVLAQVESGMSITFTGDSIIITGR